MCPILFEWGPIRIGSYGLLLALAFVGAIVVTNREFRRNGADLNLAWDIYLLAIIGGMGGSRTLYLLENWQHFVKDPWGVFFNGTGFSVIGGFLLAFALCAWRLRIAKASFIAMGDLVSPGMVTGYAIGRLGCITAGDGCYGVPTLMPWGMTFPHGLVPTLSAKSLILTQLFRERFPQLPVPVDIPVHPTPLYESLSAWVMLIILLRPGWEIGPGRRFSVFLAWFGISRFFVEFIRLNPRDRFGLSSDQWLSMGIAFAALILWFISHKSQPRDNSIKTSPECVCESHPATSTKMIVESVNSSQIPFAHPMENASSIAEKCGSDNKEISSENGPTVIQDISPTSNPESLKKSSTQSATK
ncbi:MAG: prolipoprotein diacylglyceryl transferase [Candidatus Riflebacteria bacterium]|nr:prolipoprotein diacylglyceryl transferase [Candidatus Riflebacteria bacterium]